MPIIYHFLEMKRSIALLSIFSRTPGQSIPSERDNTVLDSQNIVASYKHNLDTNLKTYRCRLAKLLVEL